MKKCIYLTEGECEEKLIKCYSAHCMRRKRAEIVKFNVLHTSWKTTRSASKSMRLFMSMDIP